MYGDYFLMDRPGEPARVARRLPLGSTSGRDEAWLRDLLFAHPEILPLGDIDPSFAPLVPLCCELRTEVGPLDIAYVNSDGLLTLVECKLWRNPEARRKVVAQVLDYTSAMTRWSYSDLQRQVSAATGISGNVPFEKARRIAPDLEEHRFADAVTRHMRAGRFLLLIAGDGIREDVRSLAELVNRNSAAGFTLGLVEVALHDLGEGGLAVQPRVVARTHIIERTVVLARDAAGRVFVADDEGQGEVSADSAEPAGESNRQAEYRRWWAPVVAMRFDDPDQEPVRYHSNHVRAALPFEGIWLTAYRVMNGSTMGVFLGGSKLQKPTVWPEIAASADVLLAELPQGTRLNPPGGTNLSLVSTDRQFENFPDDDACRYWLIGTLNTYANVFRPFLKRLAV